MKKILTLIIIVITCQTLSGCNKKDPNIEQISQCDKKELNIESLKYKKESFRIDETCSISSILAGGEIYITTDSCTENSKFTKKFTPYQIEEYQTIVGSPLNVEAYKLDIKDVALMYKASWGNGGREYLFFVSTTGKLSCLSPDELVNDGIYNIITLNGLENIIAVVGDGWTPYAIDSNGKMYEINDYIAFDSNDKMYSIDD